MKIRPGTMKTTGNNEKPTWNYKNQPGTINDDKNPPGIMNTRPGAIKNMKNHLELWKTDL